MQSQGTWKYNFFKEGRKLYNTCVPHCWHAAALSDKRRCAWSGMKCCFYRASQGILSNTETTDPCLGLAFYGTVQVVVLGAIWTSRNLLCHKVSNAWQCPCGMAVPLWVGCTVGRCHLLLHPSVAFVAAFGSASLCRCRCRWADHTGSADGELWKCSGSVPARQPHGRRHHPGHRRRAGAALPDSGEVLCQDAQQNYQGMCFRSE